MEKCLVEYSVKYDSIWMFFIFKILLFLLFYMWELINGILFLYLNEVK